MALVKTINFLPEVFKSITNQRFLGATMDQLVSDAVNTPLNGYIGRRFAPTYQVGDNYVPEVNNLRARYQLEPSVVIKNEANDIQLASSYIDLIQALGNNGGYTNNHKRLFESNTYSYDGQFDYDKFVNYNSYYWLPNGPEAVTVSSGLTPLTDNYIVTRNTAVGGYTFSGTGGHSNTQLTLARGGTYTFSLDQPGYKFWIQSSTGVSGVNPNIPSQSTREVFGVTNNGVDSGVVTFNVPLSTAQDFYTSIPIVSTVNAAVTFKYNEIQNTLLSRFLQNSGDGLDGIINNLQGKSIIFVNQEINDENWTTPELPLTKISAGNFVIGQQYTITEIGDTDFVTIGSNDNKIGTVFTASGVGTGTGKAVVGNWSSTLTPGQIIPRQQRVSTWTLDVKPIDSINSDYLIQIVPAATVNIQEKVFVSSGKTYSSTQFWLNNNYIYEIVPVITAAADYLYYQDSENPAFVGRIKLVDNKSAPINVNNDILGQTSYTSPNGVVFTNGLKVVFDSLVIPNFYAGNEYYVEGVGTAIQLVPVDQLVIPPEFEEAIQNNADYITINRGSIDRNPWSRTNRWFHVDVLNATAKYNQTDVDYGPNIPGRRAIIEFAPNLKLYDFGIEAKPNIDIITFYKTVAAGKFVSGVTYTISGVGTTDFTKIGADSNTVGTVFTATGPGTGSGTATINPGTFAATELVDGAEYTITSIGTTDFTLYGATENIVGFKFVATGPATGNGTATIVSNTDAFVEIEGQLSYQIDGVELSTGTKVVFANDFDPEVKNKLYQVEIELINSSNYIRLVPIADATVEVDQTVLVKQGAYTNKTFRFDGSNWQQCQEKTSFNQPPLFDLFDINGYSFSNPTVYPGISVSSIVKGNSYNIQSVGSTDFTLIGAKSNTAGESFVANWNGDVNPVASSTGIVSTFVGTKFFSYKVNTNGSTNDKILGFPLTYQNFNNIGDIVFQNYFDSESFIYTHNGAATTVNTNTGYLRKSSSLSDFVQVNNWVETVEPSAQYQVFTKFYDGLILNIDGVEYPFVQIDALPNVTTSVPHLKVYLNNVLLDPTTDYQLVPYGVYNVVTLNVKPEVNDKIDVLVLSDTVSNLGYYEIPRNLDFNPLNENFETITLGQMRTHYRKLIENTSVSPETQIPLRDQNNKAQGGTLLQHESPAIYAMTFLTDQTVNFINAIDYARKEYTKFKNKFLTLCTSISGLDYNDPVTGVDTILQNINAVKNSSFPWYYSDMVPQGGTYNTITYKVLNARQKSYEISSIFDNTVLSSRAVLVYLNGNQLLVNQDFTFSKLTPSVTINVELNINDVIVIRDYPSTDGNYIPETPTKLGLYTKFVPLVYEDNTYKTTIKVIRGHDGSITPAFNDFRDDYLMELEKRIYNNIKADYSMNAFDMFDVIPGRFRKTEYNLTEWNRLLTKNFLQWAGSNNIDYTTNTWFNSNDPWSWNYDRFTDVVDGSFLQGSWRAIYTYWFDTETPNITPWKMLGIEQMPTWWETRYGPAPYTKANSVLWDDLESGYIWNGSDDAAYIDTRFARPNLNKYIPVDTAGNLLDPTMISIIKQANPSTADNFFFVGEQGPVEASWRRSSDYPFALMTAFALAQPAKFFATQIDTSRFFYNNVVGQFTNVDDQKISPQLLAVNGDTTTVTGTVLRTSGYINWIGDLLKSFGINPVSKFENYFKNFFVQLTYKVAGYTDQNLITVTAEQTSPGSTNASIIIPDENYHVYLGHPVPTATVSYSGVVVTKTADGYVVTGYDTATPYFTIIPSVINNNSSTITVNQLSVKVYADGEKTTQNVAYGTVFSNIQQVGDFLVSYQRHLESIGFTFAAFDQDLQYQRDWHLSIREFLLWVQQGWAVGTILVLNPVVDTLTIATNYSVIGEINNLPNGGQLLNSNFTPVKSNSFDILRDENVRGVGSPNYTTFKAIGNAGSIAFAKLNLIQYEHVLVFDNVDNFGDIIYVPEQGTRQYRLKLTGAKTGAWNGSLSATGYLYSNPVIEDWRPDVDYRQGDIIRFNNALYTAPNDVLATQVFNLTSWTQIPESAIQSGLLPSFGRNAQIFNNIYDVDNPPQDENYQIYSAGLIGFRPRPFLSNLGISVPTQTKFYQGYIKQKGTANAIDALTKATFDTISSEISTFEEWAFQVGIYGDVENNKYSEFVLDESVFTTNPVALTLTANTYSTSNIIVNLGINTYSYTGKVTSNVYNSSNLLSVSTSLYSNRVDDFYQTDLPSCGYVNLNDVEYQIFDISTITTVPNLGTGDKIWVANDTQKDWNVYRVNETEISAIQLTYTLDNYAQLTFDNVHDFRAGDYFILQNFDTNYNGLYSVVSVQNSLNVTIQVQDVKPLIRVNSILTGKGLVYKLSTLVIDSVTEIDQIRPLQDWQNGDRVWVNKATSQGWGVYSFNEPWRANEVVEVFANANVAGASFGTSTAISGNEKWIYVGAPGAGKVQVFANVNYNYTSAATLTGNVSFGTSIATAGNVVVIGVPSSNNANVYYNNNGSLSFIQTISSANTSGTFGTSIALSSTGQRLFISEPGSGKIYSYYAASTTSPWFATAGSGYTLSGGVARKFGATIATNSAGSRIYVGAPYATNTYTNAGNVYVLNRSANTVSLGQTISPTYKCVNGQFGASIAVDSNGENVFVGVPGSTLTGFSNGAVEHLALSGATLQHKANISHPNNQVGQFGTSISVSGDAKVLAIGSPGSATDEHTTFDVNTTVIDSGSTEFIDEIFNSGSVYMFEPLFAASVTGNIGTYTYAYELEAQVFSGDNFGSSIATTRDLMVIGSNGALNAAGQGHIYTNKAKNTAWVLTRQEQPSVDINSINRTFIFDKSNDIILAALDYIDPIKGKVLNSVNVDIDYQLTKDPAVYNAGTGTLHSDFHWGPTQVGKIWWNINDVRYIDYEQDVLIYRLNNWGAMFPGSRISVYEWVESSVPPSQYVVAGGNGVPLYGNDTAYCTYGSVSQTGAVMVKYYFWVTNKTSVNTDAGKTNSVYSITAAIENPQSQGIPYITVLRDDTVALYNVNHLLTGSNSVLHLGGKSLNSGLIHTEYALVQEGNPASQIPDAIQTKLIDSLAAQDAIGNPVPDANLTPAQAYGVSVRPRQTMFVNRELALSNYLLFVNTQMILYPVVQRKIMTTLNSSEPVPTVDLGLYDRTVATIEELGYIDTSTITTGYNVLVNEDTSNNTKWAIYSWNTPLVGQWNLSRVQSYKTSLYWNYVDWYETGYDPTVEPDVTVYNNLEFGTLSLVPGQYVKVLNAGNEKFAVYYINADLSQTLVGIQDGTIQITTTETIPPLELRQIAYAIQNDIFVDDLEANYNRLFFAMVKYALTEQKNLDWVFKTSFLSATQYIRALRQFPAYISDNQNYYKEYIDEVKPYRTIVREFVIDYIGNDNYSGDVTDFDLPPYWDSKLGIYRSPNGEQSYDSTTLTSGVYSQWNDNYKYCVVDVIIENAGTGYFIEPDITFYGGGGEGATGYAIVNAAGQLVKIVITDPGRNYTSDPIILIDGIGSGALAKAVLRNVFDGNNQGHNVIRSIKTLLKFDRVNYTNSNVFLDWDTITSANIGAQIPANVILTKSDNSFYKVDVPNWQINTAFAVNSLVFYNGNTYQVTGNVYNYEFDNIVSNVSLITANARAYTISSIDFPIDAVVPFALSSLDNANDRIIAVSGNIDLTLTQSGLEYAGVVVDGNVFTSDVYDSTVESFYSNVLGVNPNDVIIDGYKYVSSYSSFGPEEFVPGRMYDSLDMQVYDTAQLSFRVFEDLNKNTSFYRIARANTTVLSNSLGINDETISVVNAAALPIPNPRLSIPGIVEINGELISYYRNYSSEPLVPWVPVYLWTANTAFTVGSLVNYSNSVYEVLGNTYAASFGTVYSAGNVVPTATPDIPYSTLITYNSNVYITVGNVYGAYFSNISANAQSVSLNTLGQIRRGVYGTYSPNLHPAGAYVVDTSVTQEIPDSTITSYIADATLEIKTTNENSITYGLEFTDPVSANIGDTVTQEVIIDTFRNAEYAVDKSTFWNGNSYTVTGNIYTIIPTWSSNTAYAIGTFANFMGNTYSINGNAYAQNTCWQANTSFAVGSNICIGHNSYITTGNVYAQVPGWESNVNFTSNTIVYHEGNLYQVVGNVYAPTVSWTSGISLPTGSYIEYNGSTYVTLGNVGYNKSGNVTSLATWNDVSNRVKLVDDTPNSSFATVTNPQIYWSPNTVFRVGSFVSYGPSTYIVRGNTYAAWFSDAISSGALSLAYNGTSGLSRISSLTEFSNLQWTANTTRPTGSYVYNQGNVYITTGNTYAPYFANVSTQQTTWTANTVINSGFVYFSGNTYSVKGNVYSANIASVIASGNLVFAYAGSSAVTYVNKIDTRVTAIGSNVSYLYASKNSGFNTIRSSVTLIAQDDLSEALWNSPHVAANVSYSFTGNIVLEGAMRVMGTHANTSVLPVIINSGNITFLPERFDPPLGFDAEAFDNTAGQVNINGVDTFSYITDAYRLGNVSVNGEILISAGTELRQSQCWYTPGIGVPADGLGLLNSSSKQADFIKSSLGFSPSPGDIP